MDELRLTFLPAIMQWRDHAAPDASAAALLDLPLVLTSDGCPSMDFLDEFS
jgi:hypothetical protein